MKRFTINFGCAVIVVIALCVLFFGYWELLDYAYHKIGDRGLIGVAAITIIIILTISNYYHDLDEKI